MSRLENVYNYTDLLSYAEEKNLCTWNECIDLLKKDGYIPFYEAASKEIWPTDGDSKSSENPILQQVIDGFCNEEEIHFITIIDG